jgi:hypothetical protein
MTTILPTDQRLEALAQEQALKAEEIATAVGRRAERAVAQLGGDGAGDGDSESIHAVDKRMYLEEVRMAQELDRADLEAEQAVAATEGLVLAPVVVQ